MTEEIRRTGEMAAELTPAEEEQVLAHVANAIDQRARGTRPWPDDEARLARQAELDAEMARNRAACEKDARVRGRIIYAALLLAIAALAAVVSRVLWLG